MSPLLAILLEASKQRDKKAWMPSMHPKLFSALKLPAETSGVESLLGNAAWRPSKHPDFYSTLKLPVGISCFKMRCDNGAWRPSQHPTSFDRLELPVEACHACADMETSRFSRQTTSHEVSELLVLSSEAQNVPVFRLSPGPLSPAIGRRARQLFNATPTSGHNLFPNTNLPFSSLIH